VSRKFPERVSNVGNDLTRVAGSFLRSVTTGGWAACEVCALPIDATYPLCVQCQNHRRCNLPVADRAGFLVYADQPASQTYRVMRGYKETRTRAAFAPIIQALLAVGLRGHFGCATKLAGTEDYGWAVVPSTKGRTVFVDLVRGLTTSPESEIPIGFTPPAPDRGLRPDSWTIAGSATLPQHVVIIDDAWVSGASSQSLAVTLKRVGVAQVSILSVARVLSPHWDPNKPFLKDALPALQYDWTICPWTRGNCP
jgi:predicted amidophosphoribosyltransferase